MVRNDFQVAEDVKACHIQFPVSARLEILRMVNHNVKVRHGFDVYLDYVHG